MASDVLAVSSLGPDGITVECCRKCSGEYRFLLPSNKIVIIFCGEHPNTAYKALSYVCAMGLEALPVSMHCRKCDEDQIINISSVSKFNQLMRLAGGGSSVFLDILSIDQSSAEALMAELLVMGETYKSAQTISVLLPSEDEQAYWILKDLAITAHAVVLRQRDFGLLEFTQPDVDTISEAKEDANTLAARFTTLLNKWSDNIKKWKYFERAWTFQEWAMAAEIEITFENAPPKEGIINIKNVIPNACTIICHYKMMLAKAKDTAASPPLTKGDFYMPLTEDPGPLPQLHAELQQREAKFLAATDLRSPMLVLKAQTEERETTGKLLNTTRALFPFPDLLIADSEDDFDSQRQKTYMLSAIDSGTYVMLPSLKKANPEMIELRSRLSLALNALHTSERKATYEADLVVCWASMCGVSYPYQKEDKLPVALNKALQEMRARGLRVFNWLANTDGGEIDQRFLDYAPSQRQCNAKSHGFMFGSPVFVGRVDTPFHLKCALERQERFSLTKAGDLTLRKVQETEVNSLLPLFDVPRALEIFRDIISGKADGTQITDVVVDIEGVLKETLTDSLQSELLVTVSIGIQDHGTKYNVDAWALIPSETKISELFVAREDLNGTLVLATSALGKARIEAYLTMTHQKYGTYLVKSNKEGVVDVVFKRAEKGGLFSDLNLDFGEDMKKLLDFGGISLDLDSMLDHATDVALALDEEVIQVE